MRISLNWIRKLIPGLDIGSEEELFAKMIEAGLDIESISYQRDKYKNLIIGEVISAEKHPNADKLTLCKVNIGKKILNIVCGAKNIASGQKVCVAMTGAVIPNGEFEIKKTKIRGVTSEGMICAEDELGLSDDHSGIMVLDNKAIIGKDFSDFIGADDIIIDIGITPNRGDLFSHIGIAREIASMYGLKALLPDIKIEESSVTSDSNIKITILCSEFCKRFTGRVVKNVSINESPEWLKKALLSVGLRPINNIVDITNYVMYETGQPLHAFDYDKIQGKHIIIKTAKDNDKFKTLDSKERILNKSSLMVCDEGGYSAIAGVMGGEFSEITTGTNNVFIESAYFDPVNIRKNSKWLGLITDASQRFERGVDIDNVVYASNRAAQMMQEIAGGEVLKGIVDVYPEKFVDQIVLLRVSRVISLLGFGISEEEVIKVLGKIEISFVGKENEYLKFYIPEFRRKDLQREIDLIEEIARLYGYSEIGNSFDFNLDLSSPIKYQDDYLQFIKETKNYLIGRGFNEILTYSQQNKEYLEKFNINAVVIENPNSVEMDSMRANLYLGMLDSISNNFNYSGNDTSLRLFEAGRIFLKDGNNYKEENHICFGISGKSDDYGFDLKERYFDFFDIKGELDLFLYKLNIENYILNYYNNAVQSYFEIEYNGNILGSLYIVSKDILETYDINIDVFIAELNLDILSDVSRCEVKYKEISKFPPVRRDIALVCDDVTNFTDIYKLIIKSGGDLLKSIKLFDVYKDRRFGNTRRSMTFTLEFSSMEKTLTDSEVNEKVNKVLADLKTKLGVELRN